MGTALAVAPAVTSNQEQQGRSPTERRSPDHQRHLVDFAHRGTLARLARVFWSSFHRSTRFYRRRQAGIWDRIFAAVQEQANAAGDLDWETHHVDATVLRAHQHAAGAKNGTHKPRRLAGAKAGSARKSMCATRATANR